MIAAPAAERVDVLGLGITAIDRAAAVERIVQAARARSGGYVCLANVHMLMESRDDPAFGEVVNGASLVLADGRPIYWLARRRGASSVGHVRGADLTRALLERAVRDGLRLAFYGSTPQVLAGIERRLRGMGLRAENLLLESPPFRDLDAAEMERDCARLRAFGADLVLVGLGCPKQERWMARAAARLDMPLVGVGAVFEFLAGTRPEAPRPLRAAGLEWAFRLGTDWRRLWRRYLSVNPRFAVLALPYLLGLRR